VKKYLQQIEVEDLDWIAKDRKSTM